MIKTVTVINLDRTPQRFAAFLDANPGLPVKRFSACDSAHFTREHCVRTGLITNDNLYRPGAIGNALSHITLWRKCAAGKTPLHIAEDDAILRGDFRATAGRLLRGLASWDIVLWTYNLDWPVMLAPPGLGALVAQFDQAAATASLADFPAGTTAPMLLPLMSAASVACYSISPAGAARALAACLPLGATPARYAADPARGWRNTAIDVELSRHYPAWQAYAAMPPLAIVPNDQENSTVRGHLAAMHDPASTCRAPI